MPWGCCHRRDLHPKKHPGGIQPPPRPGVGGGTSHPAGTCTSVTQASAAVAPPPQTLPPPPSSSQGFSPHRSIPNPISRNGGSPGGVCVCGGVWGGPGSAPVPARSSPGRAGCQEPALGTRCTGGRSAGTACLGSRGGGDGTGPGRCVCVGGACKGASHPHPPFQHSP